jgi:hypothetical protein
MLEVALPKGAKSGAWQRQTMKTDGGPAPIQFLPVEGLEIMNVFIRELK